MKKKITLVRVGVGKEDTHIPTPMDLEYWRACFEHPKNINTQQMQEQGVKVETFEVDEDSVMVVKIGSVRTSDSGYASPYIPSKDELENWRKIFEEAQGDPDFKIFTHANVELKQIPIGKTTLIVTGGDAVVVGQDSSSIIGEIC